MKMNNYYDWCRRMNKDDTIRRLCTTDLTHYVFNMFHDRCVVDVSLNIVLYYAVIKQLGEPYILESPEAYAIEDFSSLIANRSFWIHPGFPTWN